MYSLPQLLHLFKLSNVYIYIVGKGVTCILFTGRNLLVGLLASPKAVFLFVLHLGL